MTSSAHIANRLDRCCPGNHEHVHLMGGRAAAAQESPPALCEEINKAFFDQKKADRRISTAEMSSVGVRDFVHALGGGHICSVREMRDEQSAGVECPDHWIDPVHEEDGGCDVLDCGHKWELSFGVANWML